MERSTIHLLHKRGKSQREIASELGHSRSAVARVLEEPVDRQASGRRRESNVDPFREQIGEWLKQGLSEQHVAQPLKRFLFDQRGDCLVICNAPVLRLPWTDGATSERNHERRVLYGIDPSAMR